jgi:hypothetical protein
MSGFRKNNSILISNCQILVLVLTNHLTHKTQIMNYTGKLLTNNNAKTVKGRKKNYETYIMYLSPFTQNSKGINLCSHASEGCAAACLFGSGFGGMFTNVEQGRINKTDVHQCGTR